MKLSYLDPVATCSAFVCVPLRPLPGDTQGALSVAADKLLDVGRP